LYILFLGIPIYWGYSDGAEINEFLKKWLMRSIAVRFLMKDQTPNKNAKIQWEHDQKAEVTKECLCTFIFYQSSNLFTSHLEFFNSEK